MEEKDILSAQEFARCVGVHYNTVRKMIRSGRLNAFKIGTGGLTSDLRIPRSEIQRLSLVSLETVVDDLVEERIKFKRNKELRRFFSKVEKTPTCWLWKGATTKSGYGVFSLNKKYIRAHRASYILHVSEIQDDLLVLHSCDVRNCVNPDHLHLGTPQDNIDEMFERNRERFLKGENSKTSKLSDDDVIEIRLMKKLGFSVKEISIKFDISSDYVYQLTSGKFRQPFIKSDIKK